MNWSSNCGTRLLSVALAVLVAIGGRSAKADFTFGEPVNLGPAINSEYDDGKPSLSADGLTMYFSSNRPGGYGEFDLWMSARAALTDDWSAPVNLGEPVNSEADEIFPCVSPDGLELYFNEWGVFRPEGYGGGDIWVAKRPTTDDPWGEPVNAGEAVNSTDYDSCPYLSPDGLLLFLHGRRRSYLSWTSTGMDVSMTRMSIC